MSFAERRAAAVQSAGRHREAAPGLEGAALVGVPAQLRRLHEPHVPQHRESYQTLQEASVERSNANTVGILRTIYRSSQDHSTTWEFFEYKCVIDKL